MNKFLDEVRTERTARRYVVRPEVRMDTSLREVPAYSAASPTACLFVTRAVLEVRTVARPCDFDRVDAEARAALLSHLYGEAAKRVHEIRRAAHAGDTGEVAALCELLVHDMLTPTAKDRS
ncbi:hypothetical protein [Pandoraea communis]|uniref:hypothetical protein n=1 Tax=Pandoraea communis TaxID=2508297 RepID=UPI0025A67806|nr:hypothetical protein [Pandoraea communis]MDM8358819.1 hypothetical protein [Pandoraea communis]